MFLAIFLCLTNSFPLSDVIEETKFL